MAELSEVQEEIKLTLRPANPDFFSPKVQIIWCAVAALVFTLVAFSPSFSAGFLLDDFLHLDYVLRALRGDAGDFLANFTGNWAGSDIMRSYRPLTSLSLLVDAAIWGPNPWGFHLTNILLTWASGFFVALITQELTGPDGNRLRGAAAIWAMFLFLAYPLHPEASAWIIGRVDLLCTLFYLMSVFCYLRFRAIREKYFLIGSLAAFIASLLCKEMAVTLPIVIATAELTLFKGENAHLTPEQRGKFNVSRTAAALSFWVVLSVIAVLRAMALGTMVGGYDASDSTTAAKIAAMKNLLDKATMYKIFFPASEEMPIISWMKPALIACYATASGITLIRCAMRSINFPVVLFLIGWCVVSVVPAFQIWHIHPNLVGSRLVYLLSAPLSILLALMLLPAIDALPKKAAQGLSIVGSIALSGIFIIWTLMLSANLVPWATAGQQMKNLQTSVVKELSAVKGTSDSIAFLDLPTDYKGAGMLTRSQYLEMLVKPPLYKEDLSAHVKTIEPPVSGSHEFLWPTQLRSVVLNSSKVFIWNHNAGQFDKWLPPQGEDFSFDVEADHTNGVSLLPPNLVPQDGDKWHTEGPAHSAIEDQKQFLTITPGREQVTLSFKSNDVKSPASISPLAERLDVRLKVRSKDPESLTGKIRIRWNAIPAYDVKEGSLVGEAFIPINKDGTAAPVWIGRYRNWSLTQTISTVALVFDPGDYEVDFYSMEITRGEGFLQTEADVESGKIRWGGGSSSSSNEYRLLMTHANRSFDANSPLEIATPTTSQTGKLLVDQVISGPKGSIELPAEVKSKPGIYQIRTAPQKKGTAEVSGFPGEPFNLLVKRPQSN